MTLPSELRRAVPSSSVPRRTSGDLVLPLRGIIAAMVTPLREQDSLDVPGLKGLVEHILGGGVHGGANLCPQLYVQLYKAARKHDLDQLAALHHKVMQSSTGIYNVGRGGSSYLKGLKCALSVLGICDDLLAEPLHRFDAPERLSIERQLRSLGLLP